MDYRIYIKPPFHDPLLVKFMEKNLIEKVYVDRDGIWCCRYTKLFFDYINDYISRTDIRNKVDELILSEVTAFFKDQEKSVPSEK